MKSYIAFSTLRLLIGVWRGGKKGLYSHLSHTLAAIITTSAAVNLRFSVNCTLIWR